MHTYCANHWKLSQNKEICNKAGSQILLQSAAKIIIIQLIKTCREWPRNSHNASPWSPSRVSVPSPGTQSPTPSRKESWPHLNGPCPITNVSIRLTPSEVPTPLLRKKECKPLLGWLRCQRYQLVQRQEQLKINPSGQATGGVHWKPHRHQK